MESARVESSPGRRRPARVAARQARPSRATPPGNAPLTSFSSELLDADRRERRRELMRALGEVDRRAEALRRAPSDETLFAYREAVKRFLQLALPGTYSVDRQVRLDARGTRRLQVVVQRVDQELDRLANEVLQRQRDLLSVAARLAEIRGLLLDLVR